MGATTQDGLQAATDAAADRRARDRDRPGARWWLALLAACSLARAAWWAVDSMPMLFLGDSEAYLATAVWNRVPSDRSFVYGYVVLLAAVLPGSLRTLVALQSACSVAAALILASVVLELAPGRRTTAAAIAVGWAALEPLSLFWERYVMAEGVALPVFGASVLCGLRYLSTRRFAWLAAADLAAMGVATLRLPYLGMCWLGAIALPLLGLRRGHARVAIAHALASVLLVGGLHAGYRVLFSHLAGGDPAFQRADGLFLVSAWAPLLEAEDFPDRALGESLLRLGSVCLIGDRRTREQQRWRDGCLVQELLKATRDEDEANEVAEAAARSIARRKPFAIARLALESWTDFFDVEQLSTVMEWDRSPWDYPQRIRVMLAERFGLDGEAMPRLSTATNRWFLRSMPWLLLLAFSPVLAWGAFGLRTLRHHRAAQAAWVAILATGLVSITVVAATSPIPRYLHPLGWLAGAWLAEWLDPGPVERRARARARSRAVATALLAVVAVGAHRVARAAPSAVAREASSRVAHDATDGLPRATVSPATEPGLVGPAAARPAPVLAAVVEAWETMKATRYDHREKVDRAAGTWFFDCVGATSAFLRIAAPRAHAELVASEGVRRGFVPSPRKYAHFLRSLPARGSSTWVRVETPAEIRGGDVVLVPPPAAPPASGRRAPGHAMIAAGPAERLRDGSYALLVYDSTATPHGDADTRRTDPRNLPLPGSRPPRPSGLGRGTVRLSPRPDGRGWYLRWSVGSRKRDGGAVLVGRALS